MTSEITILKKLWKERNRDKYNLSLKWFFDTFHLNTNNIKIFLLTFLQDSCTLYFKKWYFHTWVVFFSIVTKYITFSYSLNTFLKHKSCQNIHKLTFEHLHFKNIQTAFIVILAHRIILVVSFFAHRNIWIINKYLKCLVT